MVAKTNMTSTAYSAQCQGRSMLKTKMTQRVIHLFPQCYICLNVPKAQFSSRQDILFSAERIQTTLRTYFGVTSEISAYYPTSNSEADGKEPKDIVRVHQILLSLLPDDTSSPRGDTPESSTEGAGTSNTQTASSVKKRRVLDTLLCASGSAASKQPFDDESYQLRIVSGNRIGIIEVSAYSPRGIFYGACTLCQLIIAHNFDIIQGTMISQQSVLHHQGGQGQGDEEEEEESGQERNKEKEKEEKMKDIGETLESTPTAPAKGITLPCVMIVDSPSFAHRGVMLDISRDKVPSLKTLFMLVDELASLKFNQLQLYMEHTFAYRDHKKVWEHASPLTGEDILRLDRYCRERFIELVPNQNSFGHFHRWLKHKDYAAKYAEVPEGKSRATSRHKVPEPFGLAPSQESVQLLDSLYGELLPHFSSNKFNVGLDETFDLGKGRSKALCKQKGKQQVYIDFLCKVHELASVKYGKQMLYWGDIVLKQPNFIGSLPKDAVSLIWGYEGTHPFAKQCAAFESAQLPFYVCPGTSTWNTVCGRTKNAIVNLKNAAVNGSAHHALGYLITDWGDNGHWQPLPVSYLGLVAGANYSWNAPTSMDSKHISAQEKKYFTDVLDIHIFKDRSRTLGKVFWKLGNTYQHATKGKQYNGSSLARFLQDPSGAEALTQLHLDDAKKLFDTKRYLKRVLKPLKQLTKMPDKIIRDDADLILQEAHLAGNLILLSCKLALLMLLHQTNVQNDKQHQSWSKLASKWDCLMKEFEHVWKMRNRVGGLVDSMARFQPLTRKKAYSIFLHQKDTNNMQDPTIYKPTWTSMLLGIAMGDAFGAGVEWQSREWIREHVDFTKYVNARPSSWAEGFSEGKYTDDTEMNIGVIKCLMDHKGKFDKIDKEVLINYWQKEYEDGKKKFGHGRQGHGAIKFYFDGQSSLSDIRSAQSKKATPGNAPTMRVVPFCFLPEDEMNRLCIENADTTHPHPKVRASCLIVARAARYLIVEHGDPRDVIPKSTKNIESIDTETAQYMAEVDKLPDYHDKDAAVDYETLCGPQPLQHLATNTPVYGLGSDAMRTAGCALYILKHYRGPFDTLKGAIRIGGDVGSLAAICMGIVGTRYGLDDLPGWLFDVLEDKEKLIGLAIDYQAFIDCL